MIRASLLALVRDRSRTAATVLAVTLVAFYLKHLHGAWRGIYVIGAVLSLYFNLFVLIAQVFLKIPALHALAPTGSEPPFAIAQAILLIVVIAAGVQAFKRFRPSA